MKAPYISLLGPTTEHMTDMVLHMNGVALTISFDEACALQRDLAWGMSTIMRHLVEANHRLAEEKFK